MRNKGNTVTKLEKAILTMNTLENVKSSKGIPRVEAILLFTLLYFILLLAVPLEKVQWLIWFGIYPIIFSGIAGISYGRILLQSLIALPFVAAVGIFNPILDTRPAFHVGSAVVSIGWITFTSIILRGLFSVQSVLVLINAYGFNGILRGMERLKAPRLLTRQLGMVYRYLRVLMEESLSMRRARESRGMGKKIPLRMWGPFVGQLFIRTYDRASRIQQAIDSRSAGK